VTGAVESNRHASHVRYIDVDDFNVVYESCYFPGGETMCGNQAIRGETTSARAEAIRRAARQFRREHRVR
jgi:hypothetical protein